MSPWSECNLCEFANPSQDLHAPKYYPNFDNLDATPELKCAMLDSEKTDKDREFNGCQRLYFMSMSKAMASECSGEVFLMTMTDLREKIDVPKNGIWWQVEFPTLIDPNRPEDKRITKVSTFPPPPSPKAYAPTGIDTSRRSHTFSWLNAPLSKSQK
jgi:hypothetical protein